MDTAVRQLPHQPGIDRAEEAVAAAQPLGDGGTIAKQPSKLAGREGRIEVESRLSPDQCDFGVLAQFADLLVAAPALPDDGGHDGFAGMTVPYDEGLGLIGDA